MTTFSDSPGERVLDWGPQRTSIVAIVALVFSLPCFVPGAGLVALLLAVFALAGIARSQGRVGGTGLAVTALVLGLLSTGLWAAAGYGSYWVWRQFDTAAAAPAVRTLEAIEDNNLAGLKPHLLPASADLVTQDSLENFRTEMKEKLGLVVGPPDGLIAMLKDYMALGRSQQIKPPADNQTPQIPIPIHFEKGLAVVLLEVDPNDQKQDTPDAKELLLRNLTIVTPARERIVLIDPKLLPAIKWKAPVEIKVGPDKVKGGKPASEPETPARPPAGEKPEVPAKPDNPG